MLLDKSDICGVILAGGRGSRLGGQDKGLLPVGDRQMIERALERFVPQVDTVLVNANRNLDQYREFGYTVVEDRVADFPGPLAGIAAALAICDHTALAVVPCDSPFFPLDLVARLSTGLASADADISVARAGQRPQPVFMLVRRELFGSLERYLVDGGRKITAWYRSENHIEVDFGEDDSSFANINAADDVRDAMQRLRTP